MAPDPPRRWRIRAQPEIPDAVAAALASDAAELTYDSCVFDYACVTLPDGARALTLKQRRS
jgi:hypothetical protein